jgi:uncharacterized protein YndB with AHSA1/START domain
MSRPVRLSRTLPYAPEVVWEALTDRGRLGEWMAENDFEPRVGHRFELRTGPRPGWDGILRCQVIELDPPRRLRFSCTSDLARRGTVTISLTQVAKGTHLLLEHEGLGQQGRGLLALLLPPAWGTLAEGAPARGARRVPAGAVKVLVLVVAGLGAAIALAMRGPADSADGGIGGTASHRCDQPKQPAPPAEDVEPAEVPMVLAAGRARR